MTILKRGNIILIITIITILTMSILLSGCNMSKPKTGTDGKDTKYFTGYRGIDTEFTRAMPPDKIYYYGDSDDNSFDVNVEVRNKGSSWSRGGIFVSGFDPTMVQIEGVNPLKGGSKACQLDIGNIGFGKFGGFFRCNDFSIGLGGSNNENDNFEVDFADVSIQNIWKKLGLGEILGDGDIQWSKSGDKNTWSVMMDKPGIDAEYAGHGRLMLGIFSGINFERTFGQSYLLQGNTYEYPGGESAYVNFDGKIITWPRGLDQTPIPFMITNCYLYSTYAAPVVCIDPMPYTENAKVCTAKPYTGTSGQGAPVSVTLIEQENTPRQAIFTIHVKNTGDGVVYDPGRLEKCSPYSPARATNEDLNVVYIGDIRVSGDLQRLECSPNDFIRLDSRSKEGIITCSYDMPYGSIKSAYQAPLVVELWYGYSTSIEKRVTVKRAI
jgi:hypothetical protein